MSTIQVPSWSLSFHWHIFPIRESQRSHRGQGSGGRRLAAAVVFLRQQQASRPVAGPHQASCSSPAMLVHGTEPHIYFGMCVVGSAPRMGDWLDLRCDPLQGFVPGTQCDICSDRSCPNHCLPELLLTIPLQPAILRWALPQPCAQPQLRHSTTCITGIPPAVLLRKRAEPTRRTERAGEEAASFCTPAPYSAELPETAGVRMGGGKCHLLLYPELFSPGV